jgi:tRNA(adenine34) deaminase
MSRSLWRDPCCASSAAPARRRGAPSFASGIGLWRVGVSPGPRHLRGPGASSCPSGESHHAEPPRARATTVAVAPPPATTTTTTTTAPDADAAHAAALAADEAADPASDPLLDAADRHWMGVALEQARLAGERGEVPVGAVVVVASQAEEERGGQSGGGPPPPPPALASPPSLVLGAPQGNRAEAQCDPTAHAETLALRSALASLSASGTSWRAALPRATLYATCEPCPMCAGAALACRVGRVVYGCRQPRVGADGSWLPLLRAAPSSSPSSSPSLPPAGPLLRGAGAGGQEGKEGEESKETAGERGAPLPLLPPPLPPPPLAPPPPRSPHPYNPGLEVRSGVRGREAAELLQAFFKRRRRKDDEWDDE